MPTLVTVKAPECCDRCSARAFWRYTSNAITPTQVLCFCEHHSHALMAPLKAAGFTPAMLVVRTPKAVDA